MSDEKRIDVLAVMVEDANDALYHRREVFADRGREAMEDSIAARKAVAELIEAATKVATRQWTHMDAHSLNDMMDLRDALNLIGATP